MDLIPDLNRESLRVSSVPHLVLFFCILLVITGAMYIRSIQTSVSTEQSESKIIKEKTIVSMSDVSKTEGKDRLPSGFPDSIPVETNNIVEGVKTEFPDRGFTQYTVTYTSNASSTDIQKQYETFFDNESYVKKSSANQIASLIQLQASKNDDDISVVIESTSDQSNKVYVIFLDRQ